MSRRAFAVALLVGFSILFCASNPMAQEAWERIAVLGVSTQAVGFGGSWTFAGTSRGVWRSPDQGVSWEQSLTSTLLAQSVVMDLVVSPSFSSDGTVFVITQDGRVWRSTNAGSTSGFTFTQIKGLGPDKSPGTSLAIHPEYNIPSGSNRLLFAGHYGDGLYYTTNAGSSTPVWTSAGGPLARIHDLAISPDYTNTGLLLVGGVSNDGPLWMRNSTGQWANKATGLGSGPTDIVTALLWPRDTATGHQLAFAGTLEHGMYRTTNLTFSGGTWAAACDGQCNGTGCTGTVPRVHAMDRATASAQAFIEGRADGAFFSDDDGASCAPLDISATIQAVAFQPEYNGTSACYVFFGTPHGLFRKVVGSCAPTSAKRGPEIVDGYAVALAGDGAGQFMGSLSEGLFKCVDPISGDRHNMVRYNNFPNKQIPQVVAIALNPAYNETYADCEGGLSELFVGVNFPKSPADNGVYRSIDFGNTWLKLSTNWPTSTTAITVYDLAISPNYASDGKLYVGTSLGLYRWDGGTAGWQSKFSSPVYAVGLPPNFSYSGGSGKVTTLWVGSDDGTLNTVYSNATGGDGTWFNRGYSSAGTPRGRVTGFAFPAAYNPSGTGVLNNIFVSATVAPSTQSGVVGGVYRGYVSGTFWFWESKSPTSGADSSWDIAAEPGFDASHQNLLLATNSGIFHSPNAAASWNLRNDHAAYAVTYDRADASGQLCMAGYQGNLFNGVIHTGSGLSATGGGEWPITKAHTGYHYLPDDVWASVAHERDPDILFSSSPSMGVFASEDKGISFRPWNRGIGGGGGPCALKTGLGINMLADRRGSGLDVVWVGTDGDGIKGRYIFYNTSITPPTIDLDTSNGIDANGWVHNAWTPSGDPVTGRWERIEVTPNTACNYPVWATSPTQGMASLQGDIAVCSYSEWKAQNSGLASLVAKGVRQGFQFLQSGTTLPGESVPYHQWNYYQVQVPAGTQDLRVVMDDLDDMGSLDPDLYLRHGALPGLNAGQYEYRPYINGDETVCVRPAANLFSGGPATILSEAFASGIPASWTVVDGGSGGGAAASWTTANPCTRSIGSPFSSPFAIADGDCAGNGATQDEQLITPSLNLSGYSAASLTFSNQFRWTSGYGNDVADVDVSTDGGTTWTNLLRMTGASDGYSVPNTKSLDLTPYAGKPSVKVRFHYTGAWDYWWAVDNVEVTGLPAGWSIRPGGSLPPPAGTWSTANPCGRTVGAPLSAPFLIADSSCAPGGATFSELLYTPAVDCSAYAKVTLSYDLQFNWVDTSTRVYVYVSNDAGASWSPVKSYTGSGFGPATDTVNISTQAAGKSYVLVRFYYYDTDATGGGWAALDNIRIDGEGPKPGTWYIGVYGYAGANSTYNLTATRNVGCVATPPGLKDDGEKREERAESGCEEGLPQPEAPSSSSTWGTVSGSGVYKGTGSASAMEAVTWVLRNGSTSPLTNLAANTVVQLSDLTVVAGCDGDVFYSPAPDEGATTWVNATANVAAAGSNDFRDLLVSSNGDVLLAANGAGTGTSAGGVWLSGDRGAHWMRLSSGFDADSQELTDLMVDGSSPPSYYASTGATGEYTRTITADAYPTVSAISPSSGPASGNTTVTLSGTGFLGTCPTGTASDCPSPNDRPVVLFGETEVIPSSWGATSIICTTPAGAMGATKVTVRNPDTRRSSTGPTFTYTCSAPSPVGTLTATDLSPYNFTGVSVTWTAPGNWGDGADVGRSYLFYRDGYSTNTYTTATTSKTESLPLRVTPHTYFVRQSNGCGQSANTNSATAGDDAEAGAFSTSARDMKWNSGGKSQLDWGDMTGETSYTVYRGNGATVSDLATGGGASACAAYAGALANTGATLLAEPASGQFYWYLVTASRDAAEGTLGTGSGASARKVASSGACGTP